MKEKGQSVTELRSRGIVKLRDEGMYSMWVKTACCNLNSNQLRKLAEITENYAHSYLLFTTRQIPIIPFVNQKDLAKVTEELSTVYLELDRCGPTVRNVNVCYDDKICPQAVTNSLSLGEKLDNFFRMPMARKVKIGVSGCAKDCVVARVLTDIGFIAVERSSRRGYDAFFGGRLGLNPFVGTRMAEGLSEEGCVRLVQNYFDFMNREGKPGERAADLIVRFGEEKVKSELVKNLEVGTGFIPVKCETKLNEDQTHKMVLRVRATCGEVTAEQLRKIADIADRYGRGFVHFAVRGSPEIPCVDKRHLKNIEHELQEVGLEVLRKGIDNLQSCFGTYCTESNADPQSLLRRIERLVAELGLDDLNIRTSASGCPNACGIPQLNDLGFLGVVEPEVDKSKCSGCELCVPVCKRKAIAINEGVAIINKGECRHCGQCITVCPMDALREKRRGFEVLVGGREGPDTRLGQHIAEFLSEDEALKVAETCLRMLKRKKVDMATIIDEVGIEKIKEGFVTTYL